MKKIFAAILLSTSLITFGPIWKNLAYASAGAAAGAKALHAMLSNNSIRDSDEIFCRQTIALYTKHTGFCIVGDGREILDVAHFCRTQKLYAEVESPENPRKNFYSRLERVEKNQQP